MFTAYQQVRCIQIAVLRAACTAYYIQKLARLHAAEACTVGPWATSEITEHPHAPSGVAVFMSAHSKTPYNTPSMDFPSDRERDGMTQGVAAGFRLGRRLAHSTPCAPHTTFGTQMAPYYPCFPHTTFGTQMAEERGIGRKTFGTEMVEERGIVRKTA